MGEEFNVHQMCEHLVDKNGNRIDVNELAGAYLSVFELKAFFRKCTDYSDEEIYALSKYIDKLDGTNYRFPEAAKVRKRIEEAAGVKRSIVSKQIAIPICVAVFLVTIWRLGAVVGEGNTAALIVYTLFVIGICLAIVFPQIQAQRKYGKGEFKFLGKFKFVSGLNLPQNAKCKVVCLNKKIAVEAIGQEVNLSTEKIINVDILTNTEIQKQYVSSVGGAIAGAMVLGAFGAILGGAATQRNIKINTKYLIFTYRGEDKPEYIIFDASNNIASAKRFCKEFRGLNKNSKIKIDI
ncbi:hypothetical protein [Oscillibacter sp.]|uniref:hypothetical protein n=1 Tax=Oscillibacter sp. TaxID=1945593 RepID=UPI002899615B|nr:hypothetical protein [Oscillibacter sp.]